jgi:hypothetical protein
MGGLDGPPKPPSRLGSAPGNPGRSSTSHRYLGDPVKPGRYSNWAARQRSAAPRPSFSRISSNFTPTSVRAA